MNYLKKYLKIITTIVITNLVSKKKSNKKIPLNENSNVLIFILKNKSESLLITPLLQLIYENTKANISVLANENNEIIFKNNPYVNSIIICEKDFSKQIFQSFLLRKNKFDVLINCSENINETEILFSSLVSSKYKIGFNNISDKTFSHIVDKLNIISNHYVDRILQLCEVFEFTVDKSRLNILYKTNKVYDEDIDKYILSQFSYTKLLAIINISGEVNNTFWGIDNYKKLIKYLKNYEVNIIVAFEQNNIEEAEKISDGKENIFLTNEFDKYASLISKSNFVFTVDSFTLQLAASYKKRVFCLFPKQKSNELIRVPYISDFDFVTSEKDDLSDLHYGKVLNSFIPYFDFVYEDFQLHKYKN